jgi:hypothetical protein
MCNCPTPYAARLLWHKSSHLAWRGAPIGGLCSEPLANVAVGQWRGRYRPILLALVLGPPH